jgi:hypothetical protein
VSTPAEKYVTHWDGNKPMSPQWITRLEGRANQSYHYTREAADQNTAHLNELVKLRSENAALRGKVEQLERAILRYAHIEETLASTVRGLEFELEKAEKATAMLRGTVEALGDANDRLTIEISGLRKEVRRE